MKKSVLRKLRAMQVVKEEKPEIEVEVEKKETKKKTKKKKSDE